MKQKTKYPKELTYSDKTIDIKEHYKTQYPKDENTQEKKKKKQKIKKEKQNKKKSIENKEKHEFTDKYNIIEIINENSKNSELIEIIENEKK